MNIIQATDTILARGTFLGRTVVDFSSTGFDSIDEVLGTIAAEAGVHGMLRISLRNATQGWSQNRAMFIAPPAPGTQLTLF